MQIGEETGNAAKGKSSNSLGRNRVNHFFSMNQCSEFLGRLLKLFPVFTSHRQYEDYHRMSIAEGFGRDGKREKPRLVMTLWVEGLPLAYKCSRCGQAFLFPEDRTPKEGAEELWAAFDEHVHEVHAAVNQGGEDGDGREGDL